MPARFERFAEALVRTMSHAVGHRFTPKVRAAWTGVCERIIGQLRRETRAAA